MTYKEAKRYLENLVGDRSMRYIYTPIKTDVLIEAIEALEEVEKHKETFEWCTDCKEYDQKGHCCHRWCKQIRDTVEELKQEANDSKVSACEDKTPKMMAKGQRMTGESDDFEAGYLAAVQEMYNFILDIE
ncbi:MAG: hypothetical protein KBS66_07530 [Eubacterium sp.]|nr:hypothetical protein [Candidatus Colimonas fimequi]